MDFAPETHPRNEPSPDRAMGPLICQKHQPPSKWVPIRRDFKSYRRKYPLTGVSIPRKSESNLGGYAFLSSLSKSTQEERSRRPVVTASDSDMLEFKEDFFSLQSIKTFFHKVKAQAILSEKDLVQLCRLDRRILDSVIGSNGRAGGNTMQPRGEIMVNESQYTDLVHEQLTTLFDMLIDCSVMPFAEVVQVEIREVSNTSVAESLIDEETLREQCMNELQLKTTRQFEDISSRGGLVRLGEVLESVEKSGIKFESRIFAFRHNTLLKKKLLISITKDLEVDEKYHAPLLQEILSFSSLHRDVTKLEWKIVDRGDNLVSPVNIVQFYKEAPSLKQMLLSSFRMASQLDSTSCCYLLQYPVGSLCLDFINHLGAEIGANVFEISPYDIYSKLYQGEKGIANFSNQLFQIANESHPAIIVLDQIESFFPEDDSEKDHFLIHEMLKIFKSIQNWKIDGNYKAVFVGISSDLSVMDSFVRKKFDEEVILDIPNLTVRTNIIRHTLKMLLHESAVDRIRSKNTHSIDHQYPEHQGHATLAIPESQTVNDHGFERKVDMLVEKTHGYTMSDIENMIQKVSTIAMKRFLFQNTKQTQSKRKQSVPEITIDDFIEYTTVNRPLSLQQNAIALPQRPNVTWDEIGGLKDVKGKLEELIVWPLRYASLFKKLNVRPPSGLLLYGPPGVGKTLIAKAVCTTAKTNFISVNIPDLIRAEIGESEKALAQIFRRAKLAAPCVIFFDEIQAMFGDRSSVGKSQQKLISQFILELDALEYHDSSPPSENSSTPTAAEGEEGGHLENAPPPDDGNTAATVLVIAATNVPHHIDPTLLRSKRLEYCIHVGLPDEEARKCIFEQQFAKLEVSPEVWGRMESKWIEETEGYSGADLVNVCQQAGLSAVMRNASSIQVQDFENAMKSVKPGASKSYLEYLENWKPSLNSEDQRFQW